MRWAPGLARCVALKEEVPAHANERACMCMCMYMFHMGGDVDEVGAWRAWCCGGSYQDSPTTMPPWMVMVTPAPTSFLRPP